MSLLADRPSFSFYLNAKSCIALWYTWSTISLWRESLFQREIKVCKTSLIHVNNAVTLKCKSKYLFDEVEKPILLLSVIDGNLYVSLQIHESLKGTKKDMTPYITVAIYNPSSEPYYLRKETLTYNIYAVTPLESKRKHCIFLSSIWKWKKARVWKT